MSVLNSTRTPQLSSAQLNSTQQDSRELSTLLSLVGKAKISVVVSNLCEPLRRTENKLADISSKENVPEQIFPVRILALEGPDFFNQILVEHCQAC